MRIYDTKTTHIRDRVHLDLRDHRHAHSSWRDAGEWRLLDKLALWRKIYENGKRGKNWICQTVNLCMPRCSRKVHLSFLEVVRTIGKSVLGWRMSRPANSPSTISVAKGLSGWNPQMVSARSRQCRPFSVTRNRISQTLCHQLTVMYYISQSADWKPWQHPWLGSANPLSSLQFKWIKILYC